jgi:hypothetical protein
MVWKSIKASYPYTVLDRPSCLYVVKAPLISRQSVRYMNVARLSNRHTGHLYPQQISLVLIWVTGCVNPKAIVRSERRSQWTIPMTPSGIEAATFRFVAERLSQFHHRVLHNNMNISQIRGEWIVVGWSLTGKNEMAASVVKCSWVKCSWVKFNWEEWNGGKCSEVEWSVVGWSLYGRTVNAASVV